MTLSRINIGSSSSTILSGVSGSFMDGSDSSSLRGFFLSSSQEKFEYLGPGQSAVVYSGGAK